MRVTLNGCPTDMADEMSISAFLREYGYDEARTVVGVNDAVVPKSTHETAIIRDGDVVEILNFVNGG